VTSETFASFSTFAKQSAHTKKKAPRRIHGAEMIIHIKQKNPEGAKPPGFVRCFGRSHGVWVTFFHPDFNRRLRHLTGSAAGRLAGSALTSH
jgi:hypothetical protein